MMTATPILRSLAITLITDIKVFNRCELMVLVESYSDI